jgi:hyperosmotically inducible periplasmic protein
MNMNRKFLALGVTLAAATAFLASGCNREQPAPPAAKTTVGTEIDDTVVTTKVKSALLADAEVKSFDLKVETRKGAVQLSGFVDNQAQIDRAIATTRAVEGVTGVENAITLKTGTATVGNKVDDGITTAKVKSALLGDPAVKSFDIAVVTRKGEVQLSGFVDNQTQIDQAMSVAVKVEGVTRVDNQMSIKK